MLLSALDLTTETAFKSVVVVILLWDDFNLSRMQRLVCGPTPLDVNVLCLFHLHWLPVHCRILLFAFKALNGLAPLYLSKLLSFPACERSLMPSSLLLLEKIRCPPGRGAIHSLLGNKLTMFPQSFLDFGSAQKVIDWWRGCQRNQDYSCSNTSWRKRKTGTCHGPGWVAQGFEFFLVMLFSCIFFLCFLAFLLALSFACCTFIFWFSLFLGHLSSLLFWSSLCSFPEFCCCSWTNNLHQTNETPTESRWGSWGLISPSQDPSPRFSRHTASQWPL